MSEHTLKLTYDCDRPELYIEGMQVEYGMLVKPHELIQALEIPCAYVVCIVYADGREQDYRIVGKQRDFIQAVPVRNTRAQGFKDAGSITELTLKDAKQFHIW